jgi:hypothetical protein
MALVFLKQIDPTNPHFSPAYQIATDLSVLGAGEG